MKIYGVSVLNPDRTKFILCTTERGMNRVSKAARLHRRKLAVQELDLDRFTFLAVKKDCARIAGEANQMASSCVTYVNKDGVFIGNFSHPIVLGLKAKCDSLTTDILKDFGSNVRSALLKMGGADHTHVWKEWRQFGFAAVADLDWQAMKAALERLSALKFGTDDISVCHVVIESSLYLSITSNLPLTREESELICSRIFGRSATVYHALSSCALFPPPGFDTSNLPALCLVSDGFATCYGFLSSIASRKNVLKDRILFEIPHQVMMDGSFVYLCCYDPRVPKGSELGTEISVKTVTKDNVSQVVFRMK